MNDKKVRYVYISVDESLPLFVESIGYNPFEQDFNRPDGYPYYHWLQTIEGEGKFSFNGEEYILSKGKGIFLTPYTPHTYVKTSKLWSTTYITFGGASVVSIIDSLKLNCSALYTGLEHGPFAEIIKDMFLKAELDLEFSKLDLSSYLYRFLINLRKYGSFNKQPSISHLYEKVRQTVEWLEEVYAEDISLDQMAQYLNVSSQYLNRLFQATFGLSPYTFLIQLRIRKAKDILIQNPDIPLKNVAHLVGFNDVSHFVHTFRKKEGLTPKVYRELHCKSLSQQPPLNLS
jgi:AraC-like DNA-binding protein